MSLPAKLQNGYTRYPVWIAAEGDSLTRNGSCQVRSDLLWPALFQAKVNAHATAMANKSSVRVANQGVSGDTTLPYSGTTTYGMTVRLPALYRYPKRIPKLLFLWGGHNDASHTAQFPGPPANVHEEVTRPTLVAMGNTAFSSGSSFVMIVSRHVLNFATGGDISGGAVNAADSTASPALNLYAAQYNAAQDLIAAHPSEGGVPKVVFCDLYTYMRNHLMTTDSGSHIGVDTYYHRANNNVHFNELGNEIVASGIYAAIPSSWFTALLN